LKKSVLVVSRASTTNGTPRARATKTGVEALRLDCLMAWYPTQKQKIPESNGSNIPVKKKCVLPENHPAVRPSTGQTGRAVVKRHEHTNAVNEAPRSGYIPNWGRTCRGLGLDTPTNTRPAAPTVVGNGFWPAGEPRRARWLPIWLPKRPKRPADCPRAPPLTCENVRPVGFEPKPAD